MHHEIHRHNIAQRARNPVIRDLVQRLERAGTAAFAGFREALLAEFSDDMMILSPIGTGDYACEHYGRNIVRAVGIDFAGHPVSRMPGPIADLTVESCVRVLAGDGPLLTIHRSLGTAGICLWERLVFRITGVDGDPRIVIFSTPMLYHEALLETVLASSPCGIVALHAVREADGTVTRGVIIAANRRAAELAGKPGHDLVDADARATLPFLADETVWRRCLYAIELRRTDSLEASHLVNGREVWMQIALAPLGDGLVMTLTDVSDLMNANLVLQSRAATLALEVGRERATRRALSNEIGEREAREQELRRLAETDPLTALLNRRSLKEKAEALIAAADCDGGAISLFVIDLDHFKQVNDRHGHPAGDAVIRAFADLLLGHMRAGHLVGRLGGEEFAVVLPGTDADEAKRIGERFLKLLRATHLPVSEDLDLQVTASLGIATRLAGETIGDLIARADQQLYRAKNDGRDCIRSGEDLIADAA